MIGLAFGIGKNPGFFATYKNIPDSKGKFVAFLSVLLTQSLHSWVLN